jgi:hypothetical protein
MEQVMSKPAKPRVKKVTTLPPPQWPPKDEDGNLDMLVWLMAKLWEKSEEYGAVERGHGDEDKLQEIRAWNALSWAEQGHFEPYDHLLIEMVRERFGERFAKRAEALTIASVSGRSRRGHSYVEECAEIALLIEELWRQYYPDRPRKLNRDVEWSSSYFAALIWAEIRDGSVTAEALMKMTKAIDNRRRKAVDMELFFYR